MFDDSCEVEDCEYPRAEGCRFCSYHMSSPRHVRVGMPGFEHPDFEEDFDEQAQ